MPLTDEEILQLWKNPQFSGSFSGVKKFQLLLKTDYNEDISQKRLYNILRNEKLYLIHLQQKKKINRRPYDLRYYGQLVQSDVAFMYEFNGFKYFLLSIDCYSNKIFVSVLKSLKTEEILSSFRDLIKKFKSPIYEIETDQGFVGLKKFFKSENIVFHIKRGQNKANFAEFGIQQIKKLIYKTLRLKVSQNWPELIPQIVQNYNNIPLEKLGFLKPSDINNVFDSAKVDLSLKKHNLKRFTEPNIDAQILLQQKYEENKDNLQVNDYVYLNFNEKLFDKSFDVKVNWNDTKNCIFLINKY